MDHVDEVRERAADTLRAWALDEELKARVMGDPALARVASAAARRYSAGDTVADAIAAVRAGAERGHLGSIEYVGESVRDTALARSETDVFLRVTEAIGREGLPSSVSFDLSHVGSVVDPVLGLRHARELAVATGAIGTRLMISAEGSDRTDLVLDLYEALAAEHPHVGITLQARLHRSPADLERLLRYPGTIRIVKGAFLEPDSIAHRRGTPELTEAYLGLSRRVIGARHAVSIATHDEALVEAVLDEHGPGLGSAPVEFEMLMGLGTELLDRLHRQGLTTREYVTFGGDWWLYVLNRLAEHPERVVVVLADMHDVVSGASSDLGGR